MHISDLLRVSQRYLVILFLTTCMLWGCGQKPSEGPNEFLIYDRDPDTHQYKLIRSRIETLQNVDAVDGDVVYLRGGGKIVTGGGSERTEENLMKALQILDTSVVDAEYTIDSDGLIVPWDFDSAMMLTLYHHLERAAEYFDTVGVSHAQVGRLPVYYFPTLTLFGIPLSVLFSDNAAYAFTLDAFIIPPRLLLREVPLSANRGVIIHEYSHAVFNRLVHQNRRVPRYLIETWPSRITNEIRSLDEGVADIFAALAIDDPDFISPSISQELFDIDRRLEKVRYYDQDLLKKVIETDDNTASLSEQYNPYELGSVIASTVWALRQWVVPDALGIAVVKALHDIADPDASFRVTKFFNAIVPHLPDHSRIHACELFFDRLPAVQEELQCQL